MLMWLHHVVIAASSLVEAQTPIVTDRPDFTESTSVVASGWQIESGATWSSPRDGAALALPEALIRWSAGPALEARLKLPDYTASKDAKAWGEVGLGLKGRLNAPRGLDGSAWIASIGMPTEGSTARPSLAAAWVWDKALHAGAVAGMSSAHWADGRIAWMQTLALSTDLTPNTSAFIEGVAEGMRKVEDTILHLGLAHRPDPRRQWDIHVGFGRASASGAFLGIGYSERR